MQLVLVKISRCRCESARIFHKRVRVSPTHSASRVVSEGVFLFRPAEEGNGSEQWQRELKEGSDGTMMVVIIEGDVNENDRIMTVLTQRNYAEEFTMENDRTMTWQ